MIETLRSILVHAISGRCFWSWHSLKAYQTPDAVLSDHSLVQLSVAELQQLLDLLTHVIERTDQKDGYIMSIVGKCRFSEAMLIMFKQSCRATYANIQYVFAFFH
jgi:hypothetical protein